MEEVDVEIVSRKINKYGRRVSCIVDGNPKLLNQFWNGIGTGVVL